MHIFYENLSKRQEQIDRYRQREGFKVNMEYDPLTTVLTYKNVNQYFTVKSLIPPPVPVVPLTPAGENNNNTIRRKATRRASVAESTTSNNNNDSDGEDNDPDAKTSARTRTPSVASANVKTASNDISTTAVAEASAVIKILESWDEVEALGGPAPSLIEGATLPIEGTFSH